LVLRNNSTRITKPTDGLEAERKSGALEMKRRSYGSGAARIAGKSAKYFPTLPYSKWHSVKRGMGACLGHTKTDSNKSIHFF
jgi:hypothetical protein